MMNELTPDIAAGFKEARRNPTSHDAPCDAPCSAPCNTPCDAPCNAPCAMPCTMQCTEPCTMRCTMQCTEHMHRAMYMHHATRRVPQACFAIFGGGPFISEIQLAAQVRGPRTY